jgi:hypothetical protein
MMTAQERLELDHARECYPRDRDADPHVVVLGPASNPWDLCSGHWADLTVNDALTLIADAPEYLGTQLGELHATSLAALLAAAAMILVASRLARRVRT